ncbi:MAG: thioesterase [Aldersonia sp.]|nr:thioesterase [Aldersonia sp.]
MTTTPGDDLTRWIRRFHPVPHAETRLVCFPHAGGSASYYFPMSRALTPRIEVLAVQYPGRQDRRLEPFIESIPELAERTCAALAAWTDRPFAFFGHSMGAILAFEVARLMEAGGARHPLHLFASGRRAPTRYRDGRVHRYDDASLIEELTRNGGTDRRFLDDAEMRAAILPLVRSDYRAIETYHCTQGPPLTCPITALVGDSDPQTTIDEASAWAEQCGEGFDLRVFPGGHFYLDAHREAVTDAVSAAMAVASGDSFQRGGTS